MSLILHFPYVFAAPSPVHMCPRSGYFTSNDTYETNLKMLMGYLSHETLAQVGCADCVSEAKSHVREYCHNNKAGTIWYDNCLLKYSNRNFFGRVDANEVVVCAANTVNGSEPVAVSLVKENKLLRELAKKASETPQMYATGNFKLDESRKLHGLVQCTRDLSRNNCTKCLDKVIKRQLQPLCCNMNKGNGYCSVTSSSCFVRYDTSVVKTNRKILGFKN
ncbi:Cysteine-rich repeat secretory protein 38 [Morella rubra]|uniref:Cysteine-rich repeat secretory protein 38 n=1 Tax=Morella rubra TaxID=262757 RepID=A0A6A1UNL3_9ROSI|nr:Cysteine-rich repeat secretory protein 38 [Morella rubra]